jgi:chaperonin GroEL (HSP60 family)
LAHAEPHLERNIHPTVICRAYMKALDDAVALVEKLAFKIDFMDRDALLKVVDSCIATKFTRRFGTLIPVMFLSLFFHISLFFHLITVVMLQAHSDAHHLINNTELPVSSTFTGHSSMKLPYTSHLRDAVCKC